MNQSVDIGSRQIESDNRQQICQSSFKKKRSRSNLLINDPLRLPTADNDFFIKRRFVGNHQEWKEVHLEKNAVSNSLTGKSPFHNKGISRMNSRMGGRISPTRTGKSPTRGGRRSSLTGGSQFELPSSIPKKGKQLQ